MNSIVLRACAYFNWKWPKDLTSGIMFFEGKRITLIEFSYYINLVGA